MKKTIAMLLALLLVMSLAACGEKNNPPAGNEDTAAASGTPTQPTDPAELPPDILPSGSDIGTAGKYSEAYTNYENVCSDMNDIFEEVIRVHNAAIEEDNDEYFSDPNYFSDVFSAFLNISIAYTATIGDENYEVGIKGAFEMMGRTNPTIEETAPGTYLLTYSATYYDTETWESQENIPFETQCGFNAANGALHFREYATVGGERLLQSFIDFVPLGGGRYALQSAGERGIAEFSGEELVAFEYAAYAEPFDPETASVYPDGAGADAAWIMGGSGLTKHFTLTQDSLHIETPAVEDEYFSKPARDITIAR